MVVMNISYHFTLPFDFVVNFSNGLVLTTKLLKMGLCQQLSKVLLFILNF